MAVKNVVILYGDDAQMEEIIKSHLFRGEQEAKISKTFSNKGYTLNFNTDLQLRDHFLKSISTEYPKVKINYYCYIEGRDILLLYKKFQAGDSVDTCSWGNMKNNSEKGENFAKRFFSRVYPWKYENYFEKEISQES